MSMTDPKAALKRYLDVARDAMLWKLEGLSDYDVRRPLTSTGSNLLGIVKHLATVELGYFGDVFDRPSGIGVAAPDTGEDMYATADETRADIIDLYARARAHSDATIAALDLDAEGHVPWWGDVNPVTLHWILVHMIAETHRHVGHADILREGVDGEVGYRPEALNLDTSGTFDWATYRDKLEQIAARSSDHT